MTTGFRRLPIHRFESTTVGLSVPYCELSGGRFYCRVVEAMPKKVRARSIPVCEQSSTKHLCFAHIWIHPILTNDLQNDALD